MSANGPRAFEDFGDRRGAARPDEIVGILAFGQKRKAQALARADQRQRRLDRAKGRLASRAVAVEAENRLGRHRPEERALIGGQRRAERRDDIGEARLAHRDRIDIALDDDDLAALVRGLAGAMVIESSAPLWKSAVSGELRYFALAPGSIARPPKATTRPERSWIGNITRSRNRS